jgi:hypothetical protein
MKQLAPTMIPLLNRSLQNAEIPIDLWRDLAMRAIQEDRPVREIVIEALRDRLRKPFKKRLSPRVGSSLRSSARPL